MRDAGVQVRPIWAFRSGGIRSLGHVARVIHACERCSSAELDEYWELTPFELPRATPEPLFIKRFVQVCCACGHEHRELDGRVCARKEAPADAGKSLLGKIGDLKAKLAKPKKA